MSGFEFPNHPKTGPWESLKGGTLGVYMQEPIEGQNSGGIRPQGGTSVAMTWDSLLLPTVAPTRGGGTMAK